jgi:hypothetical protein
MIFLGIVELNIQPYDEDSGVGELRYVQVCNISFFQSIECVCVCVCFGGGGAFGGKKSPLSTSNPLPNWHYQ